jgi:nicotinamidase-related amidase
VFSLQNSNFILTSNMAANKMKIVPANTALFLLDLQVMYAKMDPKFDTLMNHTASIVKEARSLGITIAHCRVAFKESETASVPDTNTIFSQVKHDPSRAAAFDVNSPAAAFHSAVAPQDGDIVVRKHRVGPFINAPQDVNAIFRGRGIDTLLLGGVSTGGAVAATVVEAFDLDYQLFVVEDSCADPEKETHEFLMKYFAKRATVIKGEEVKTLVQ